MFLIVENTERTRELLPVYMLTVGAEFIQPPVRRPNGAPMHQILFVERGAVCLHADGEEIVLHEGEAAFMKKGHPVFYECLSEEARTGWVTFDGNGVEGLLSYLHAAPISHQRGESLRDLRRACTKAAERKAAPEALSLLAYELVVAYFQRLNEKKQSTGLVAAKAFMEQNCHADLSVAEVAQAAGISPSLLYRLFREEADCTPVEHLRALRVARAKRMLLECSKMPIAEIAAACGFSDTAYFCKVFRDAEHITPGGFRRAYIS